MSSSPEPATVVVGGGIAGLACAWRLAGDGRAVRLFEASPRVGGVLRTLREGRYVVELGANTVRGTIGLREIVRDVGLADGLLEADPALPRFVFHDDRLHPVPMGPLALATTTLLSAQGKTKLLGETFVARRTDASPESIATFVERRFGREVLDRLVAPLVSGTFAGDPERLEIASVFPRVVAWEAEHGSVIRGALFGGRDPATPKSARTIVSFRDGLESFPARIAARLGERVRTDAAVARVERREGGFAVALESGQTIAARSVVIAVDPWSVAPLVGGMSPALAGELESIPGAPLALAILAFPRARVRHDLRGFGFLAARGSGLGILGAIFASSLFPGRAPADEALFVAFIGGATDPDAALASEAEILARVGRDLERVLGAGGTPVWSRVERYPRAIAQYELGHAAKLARIGEMLEALPGLHLAGNYQCGISVGESLKSGLAAADRIIEESEPLRGGPS